VDRYTKYDEYKNADIIGIDSKDLQINLEYKDFNKVTNALNRLAAYEDTGLEPDEIKALKEKQVPKEAMVGPIPGYEHYTSMLLYTCPVCHSVLGDNTSGYCRFCGQKLKGESE